MRHVVNHVGADKQAVDALIFFDIPHHLALSAEKNTDTDKTSAHPQEDYARVYFF
jgi:hypothetical protein